MPSRARGRGGHAPPRVAARAPARRSSHRDSLRGAWLARHLAPARVLVYARLGSTNQTAVQRLEAGTLTAPALITTSLQTRGCGQRNNTWWSDAGSLCATFVLPIDPTMPVGQVPLRAGLAVAEMLARHLPRSSIQLKWPNDVLVGNHKIAGILCQRLRDCDVIGIGLNVRVNGNEMPVAIRHHATSLHMHISRAPRRDALLVELWMELQRQLARADWLAAYTPHHVLLGRRVRVRVGQELREGRCQNVDAEGCLQVDLGDATIRVTSSEQFIQ